MERKKEEGELLPCWSWERLTSVTEWEMPQIRGRRGLGSRAGELVVPKGRAPPGRGRRIFSPESWKQEVVLHVARRPRRGHADTQKHLLTWAACDVLP